MGQHSRSNSLARRGVPDWGFHKYMCVNDCTQIHCRKRPQKLNAQVRCFVTKYHFVTKYGRGRSSLQPYTRHFMAHRARTYDSDCRIWPSGTFSSFLRRLAVLGRNRQRHNLICENGGAYCKLQHLQTIITAFCSCCGKCMAEEPCLASSSHWHYAARGGVTSRRPRLIPPRRHAVDCGESSQQQGSRHCRQTTLAAPETGRGGFRIGMIDEDVRFVPD